jgi:phospholipase C
VGDGGTRTQQGVTRRAVLAGGLGLAGAGLAGAVLGPGQAGRASAASRSRSGSDLGAVEHVVFLMQENRSFDHYFGTYPGVRGFDDHPEGRAGNFSQAWPGAPVGTSSLLPYNLASATAQLCSGDSAVPIHDWAPQHESWAGGSNELFVTVHSESANDGIRNAPIVMGFFTRKQLDFYFALADRYTICDNYFCSVMGPTMPNRLYFMSAFIDPTGTHGGPVLETPGLTNAAAALGSVSWDTMPEVLQDKGVSWKIYQPPGTAVNDVLALALGFNVMLYFSQYLRQPGSPIYQKAFLPSWPADFVSDVKNGTLPAVSWILPPIAYSEHPNSSPVAGQWFTSQVLRTLQSNEKLWSKTVLFVNYDENGGFFDHVVPHTPPAGTPGEFVTTNPLPADAEALTGPIGLGFRVPMLVVSPFSAGGWIDSTRLDHTSALRFLESRFDVTVPNLSAWRRKAVGDLTTTLGFSKPDARRPSLPATSLDLGPDCPTPTNLVPFLTAPEPINVPVVQRLPTQERGRRHVRAV